MGGDHHPRLVGQGEEGGGQEVGHGFAHPGSRLYHQEGVLVEGVKHFHRHGLLFGPRLEVIVAPVKEPFRREEAVKFLRIDLLSGSGFQAVIPGTAARSALREVEGPDAARAGREEPGPGVVRRAQQCRHLGTQGRVHAHHLFVPVIEEAQVGTGPRLLRQVLEGILHRAGEEEQGQFAGLEPLGYGKHLARRNPVEQGAVVDKDRLRLAAHETGQGQAGLLVKLVRLVRPALCAFGAREGEAEAADLPETLHFQHRQGRRAPFFFIVLFRMDQEEMLGPILHFRRHNHILFALP